MYAQDTPDDICPVKVGQVLPSTEVHNLDGEPIHMSRIVDEGPTIMVVYRGGWCPYCNAQLAALGKKEEELREMGYQILAISPDNPEHLQMTMTDQELPYTLLSDSKLEFIDAIGVGFKVDDRTLSRYKKWNIDLIAASGETHQRLPVPTVLILDEDATVEFVYANIDYRKRLDEEVLMAAARAAMK